MKSSLLNYKDVPENRRALIGRLRTLRDTYKIDEATGQVDISADAVIQIHDLLNKAPDGVVEGPGIRFYPDAFHVFSDIIKIKLLLDIVVASSGLPLQNLDKLDEDICGVYTRSATPVQNTMFYQPDIMDVGVMYPQILNIIQEVYAAGEGGPVLTKELITGIILSYFGPYTPPQAILRDDIQDIGDKFISDILGSAVVEEQLIRLTTPGVQKPLFGFNQVEAQSMSPELWHLSGLKYAVKYLLPGLLVSMVVCDTMNKGALDEIFKVVGGD
jgi:hypothetical protein